MRFLTSTNVRCAAILITAQMMLSQNCIAARQESTALQNSKNIACKITPVKKSKLIIETILNDLEVSYTELGGGGISEIKQERTNVFVVSITQEERIDKFTYEIAVDNTCRVKILKKEPFTISFKQ